MLDESPDVDKLSRYCCCHFVFPFPFVRRACCHHPWVLVRAHAEVVRIQSFAPAVEVITWSKQRPRRMTIHGGGFFCVLVVCVCVFIFYFILYCSSSLAFFFFSLPLFCILLCCCVFPSFTVYQTNSRKIAYFHAMLCESFFFLPSPLLYLVLLCFPQLSLYTYFLGP